MPFAKPMIFPIARHQIVGKPDAEASRDAALTKSTDRQQSEIPAYAADLGLRGIAFKQIAFYGDRQNLCHRTKLQIGGLFRSKASLFRLGPARMLHK